LFVVYSQFFSVPTLCSSDLSYLPGPIYKVPFSLFAYLTLWANYVGMAEHYWEESMRVLDDQQTADLKAITEESNQALFGLSAEVARKSTRLNSSHVSISYAV